MRQTMNCSLLLVKKFINTAFSLFQFSTQEASSSSSTYIMYIDCESFIRWMIFSAEDFSASCSVRVLNSSPLAAELGLHPPHDQSDVHFPAAAVTATWPPTHSFSETGQLFSQSTYF